MRKKILYIHHGKGLGGAPLSLLYLIQTLDLKKYEPIILFLHDSQACELYKNSVLYKDKKIQVLGPVNRRDFAHTKIWWFRWYHVCAFLSVCWDTFVTRFLIARFWLKKIKPDLVHLNTSSLIAWGAVARRMGIPVIWHIREPLADGYLGLRKKIVIYSVKKYSDIIVPICKQDARPWQNLAKTNVLHNTVDPKVFDYMLSPDIFLEKNILFLGGLSQEKGTLVILRVFKELLIRVPSAKLLIAGYFPVYETEHESGGQALFVAKFSINTQAWAKFSPKKYFPAYKFKAQVLELLESIEKSVVLLGPITNVPEAMAASSVIVFPATVGHFARPIIEAGFMKKPVIASRLEPLDELVIDGQTGFLVDIADIDMWAQKLALLLTDQEVNKQMGQHAYEFCQANFGLENYGAQIEQIYARVLEQKENRA